MSRTPVETTQSSCQSCTLVRWCLNWLGCVLPIAYVSRLHMYPNCYHWLPNKTPPSPSLSLSLSVTVFLFPFNVRLKENIFLKCIFSADNTVFEPSMMQYLIEVLTLVQMFDVITETQFAIQSGKTVTQLNSLFFGFTISLLSKLPCQILWLYCKVP